MVVRDSGNVVVEHVCVHDIVEKKATENSKVTIDGRGCAAGEGPGVGIVVREGWIGVMEISERHYIILCQRSFSQHALMKHFVEQV